MKIILLKDIKKIGRKYEVKEVADGYALNMLIPNGSAISATTSNLKKVEEKRKNDSLLRLQTEDEINKAINQLKDTNFEIKGKVNDKGHLFAGIHSEQIALELKKQIGLELAPHSIILARPVKEIGEHMINLKIGEKGVAFKLIIKAE